MYKSINGKKEQNKSHIKLFTILSFLDLEHTYLSCRILYRASALNVLQYSGWKGVYAPCKTRDKFKQGCHKEKILTDKLIYLSFSRSNFLTFYDL